MDTSRLLIIALAVGFLGDLSVQLFVRSGWTGSGGWGLKGYFARHGVLESAFIASGIVGCFYALWISLNLPLRWELILPVALVLDVVWNYCHLMPSLDDYYREPVIPRTFLGVIVPFLAPLLIGKLLHI